MKKNFQALINLNSKFNITKLYHIIAFKLQLCITKI